MKNIYIILILFLSFTIYSCAKKSDTSSTTTTTPTTTTTTTTTETSTTSYVGAWVKSSDDRIALDWKSDSFVYSCLVVSPNTFSAHGSYNSSNSRLTMWDGSYNSISSSGSNFLLGSATYVPATLTSSCNPFWTNSTSENTYYTTAAKAIGYWNFTYTIISTWHDYPLMSTISTRRASDSNYYTYGSDESGNEILGTYTTSTGNHEILMTGSIINRFQVFSISSSNNTSSGCYYHYTHSSSSWTSCYSATGAKLYGTPRTYRIVNENSSDEMMEKRRQEQIIKESMRSNSRLTDKDLKAFKRYKQLLQILNSSDKEPLKRYLQSFRTN